MIIRHIAARNLRSLSAKLVLMDIEQKFERWQKARHLVHLDSTGICQYRSFFTSYRQEYAYFRLFPRSKAAPSLGQTIIRPSVTQVTAVKQSASQSPLSRITDTFCPWCLIEVKAVYWALFLHLFLPPWFNILPHHTVEPAWAPTCAKRPPVLGAHSQFLPAYFSLFLPVLSADLPDAPSAHPKFVPRMHLTCSKRPRSPSVGKKITRTPLIMINYIDEQYWWRRESEAEAWNQIFPSPNTPRSCLSLEDKVKAKTTWPGKST